MRRVACIALEARSEIKRREQTGKLAASRKQADEEVRATLVRVAEVAFGFGPTVAFDVEQRVVWVEIAGCAHLHGGEHRLAIALGTRVKTLGHACHVVVSDGPRLAAAVARFGRKPNATHASVVPMGKGAASLRGLPIEALALGDHVDRWLRGLGLTTCGALQRLPRRALGLRLEERTRDVMQLLAGEDHAPLAAWHPPEVPEERIDLDWGAASVESLAFVLKTLCDRMGARLQGRGCAACRIQILFSLDRALCAGKDPSSEIEIVLPAPLGCAADLLAVVRARLERESLVAPVLVATLRIPEVVRAKATPLSLFAPEAKAESVLPRIVAELSAELGDARVGTLALVDTWIPHERTRLAAFGAERRGVRHPLVTSTLEPSRLVVPRRLPSDWLADVSLLARVEAVQWWQRGVDRHDLLAAWIASFSRGQGALAWVERKQAYSAKETGNWLCGWID